MLLHGADKKSLKIVRKNGDRVLYIITHVVLSTVNVIHITHIVLMSLANYLKIPSRPANRNQIQIPSRCENPIPVVCCTQRSCERTLELHLQSGLCYPRYLGVLIFVLKNRG